MTDPPPGPCASSALPTRTGWRFPVVVFLLATLGFAVNYSIARGLEHRGAFNYWETMFGSDPNWYLPRLTDGSYSSKRHPLAHVLVYPPAWTGGILLSTATGMVERDARRQLVILGTPLAGAVKTVCLLLLLARMGVSRRLAPLIALIDITSLSRLVFGSIPESFGPTAVVLTWTMYLTARAMEAGGAVRFRTWFLCGLIGLGVTVTNVAPFAILLLAAQRPELNGWNRALKRCAVVSGLVCLVGFTLHFATASVFKPPELAPLASGATPAPPTAPTGEAANRWEDSLRRIQRFANYSPARALLRSPVAATSTFVAPAPGMRTQPLPGAEDSSQTYTVLRFPWEFTGEWLFLLAVVGVSLGLGMYGLLRQGGWVRAFGLAALGVLFFNGALFSVWGANQFFIFTLHWQPCLLVLLACSGFLRGGVGRVAIAASAGLLVTQIAWNIKFLAVAFDAL